MNVIGISCVEKFHKIAVFSIILLKVFIYKCVDIVLLGDKIDLEV